jgi:hypothetical protein
MPSTYGPRLGGPARGRSRGLASVVSPVNALAVCLLVLGWAALLAWTGSGPRGWQARLCADLDALPRACAAVQAQHSDGLALAPGAAS